MKGSPTWPNSVTAAGLVAAGTGKTQGSVSDRPGKMRVLAAKDTFG
ncbi:hypothetical protein [Actinomadura sp. DC4]|nr:hypothetical protein [Actinomadura sp. DC4]MDN3356476.1 hypothetical protein [Actinomadura sp. DC4]